MKHHEDTILSLSLTIITVYQLREFYAEYAICFGWITLFIANLVIIWVCVILITEKIKYYLKLK